MSDVGELLRVDEFGNTHYPDGSVLYGHGFTEYLRAIEAAPPGTLIKVGELVPVPWMKCTDCGAEMDEALTRVHQCVTPEEVSRALEGGE